jgi:hypothetical protein
MFALFVMASFYDLAVRGRGRLWLSGWFGPKAASSLT